MAATRKASIGAEIRADRSKFRADLAAAKQDAGDFRTALRKEWKLASDIGLAARVKEFRGEVLKATDSVKILAGEYRKAVIERNHAAVQMQVTGLKLREQAKQAMPDIQRTGFSPSWIGMTPAKGTATGNIGAPGGGFASNAGMGMLMLSQGIDDLQYGFKGIVNNIGPLVMALGGGPGLAGALTIAAVAVNQATIAWDKLTGTADLVRVNEENKATYTANNAAALGAAGKAGAAAGAAWADQLQRQEAGRGSRDREIGRAMDSPWVSDLQRVNRRLAEAQSDQTTDTKQLSTWTASLAENEAELAALAEQEAKVKKQWLRDKAAEAEANKIIEDQMGTGVTGWLKGVQRGDFKSAEDFKVKAHSGEFPGLSAADQQRKKYLEEQTAGQRQSIEDLRTRAGGGFQNVEDLKHDQAKTIVATGVQALADFAADVTDRATKANAEDAAKWAKWTASEKELETSLRSFFGSMQTGLGNIVDRELQTAKERTQRDQTKSDARRQLEIDTLRAGGKGKQADALQASLDLEKDTRRFEGMNFTHDEAAAMAAQSQKNSGGGGGTASGKKRIKGAVSPNMKTGLDGDWHMGSKDFFNQGLDYDFDQEKTPLNNQRGAAANRARRARDAGDKAGESAAVAELKVLTAKMDQLINAVAGTAGDRVKPSRTRDH